jgi:ATP-dependent Lon protease
VFDNELDELPAPEADTDHRAFLCRLLDAGEAGERRALARPGPASLDALDDLHARAPHMAEVTDLVRRHVRAAIAMGLPTSVPALMLLGEPGTGKTWYLSRLAALLGVPHRRYPMSGQSLADGLVGGHPTWRNARPGLVARCLLAETVANPLLLVDEVDKARTHAAEDPYRAFYDLLEPEGARNFVDEYLGFPMDASRVLWVLAGNELGPIPAPIVDRLTIVSVPAPDEAQLRAIVASVYDECNAARGRFFAPSPGEAATARLLGTNPRGIRKAVAEAMTTAAADGRRTLSPDDLVVPAPPRRRIGFG